MSWLPPAAISLLIALVFPASPACQEVPISPPDSLPAADSTVAADTLAPTIAPDTSGVSDSTPSGPPPGGESIPPAWKDLEVFAGHSLPGFWRREGEELSRYAARSWGDVAAALPLSRADRFGPTGYFETIRVGGTGSPRMLLGGLPWPMAAGGLPNAGALPRAGIDRFSIATPRILPGLALVAPGGVLEGDLGPWRGGPPVSYVAAEQGGSGYRDYRFGLSRDLVSRLSIRMNGGFRKADAFVIDSYRALQSDIRLLYRREGLEIEGRALRYDDEQYLLDPTLTTDFSHTAEDKRRLHSLMVRRGGMVGHAYSSEIQSAADARSSQFSSLRAKEKRTGFLLSRTVVMGDRLLTAALRPEKREVVTDERGRDTWGMTASIGARTPLTTALDLSLSLAPELVRGETSRGNGECAIAWRGRIPGLLRVSRMWETETAGNWVAERGRGVYRQAELGVSLPFLPSSPSLRAFRREGDSVHYLYSVDAFQEVFAVIDERTNGVEISLSGMRGSFEWEGAYLWAHAREEGKEEPLPYHSDHLVRGRLSYSRPISWFPALPRWDLLGEWRSERFAPGREVAMDDYFYLRGRMSIRIRGTDLFGQMEQVLGHQNEYLDGPVPGSDGVLSATRQVYLGLYWPFTD